VTRLLAAAGARRFEPRCWARHVEADDCFAGWAHTIRATYRVRSNLFHGEKAADVVRDQLVVKAALDVLIMFMRRTRPFTEFFRS
jgi:hypothetical protein